MQPHLKHYQHEYQQLANKLPGQGLAWLQAFREQALAELISQGFPNQRHENWKYTPTDYLLSHPFTSHSSSKANLSDNELINNLPIIPGDHYRLIFIDGFYQAALSQLPSLPKGVILQNLAQALNDRPDQLKPYYKLALKHAHGFNLLNNCLSQDGIYLAISENIHLEQPIHLIYISSHEKTAAHLHNIIALSPQAQATVIEHFYGAKDLSYFNNTLTHITLAEQSQLTYIKCQQEGNASFHLSSTWVQQQHSSLLNAHALALRGQWIRCDMQVDLEGEHAASHLQGIYCAYQQQHIDHHTLIEHRQPSCVSREWYKGIAHEQGHAIFNGKIIVAKDAQHSDAHLRNNNLLLANTAEIDTKPELEIYADDVKCAHGATVSQLSADTIFYLMSRGISETKARRLLTHAFVAEVVDEIKQPILRNYCQTLLTQSMGGSLRE
jgi:Fe-S cluster assembly protein SufD